VPTSAVSVTQLLVGNGPQQRINLPFQQQWIERGVHFLLLFFDCLAH
jgi:hypothetical protein